MNLRQRTLLSVGATLTCLIAGMYFVSSQILLQNAERLEQKEARRNLQQVSDELSYQLKEMHANSTDWSSWDDTYKFMGDGNRAFIKSNLTNVLLNLDIMAFLDSKGQVFYATRLTRPGRQAPPYADEIRSALALDRPDHQTLGSTGEFSGLLALKSGVVMVSVRPILQTSGQGPHRGWVVFGLRLNTQELALLAGRTHLKLDLFDLDHELLPQDCVVAMKSLLNGDRVSTHPLNAQTIAGYSLVKDAFGHPIRLLRVRNARTTYAEALTSQRYLLELITVAGLAFTLVILWLLEYAALSRVSKLSLQVERIGSNNDGEARVSLPGKDELSWLAKRIDDMVQGLRQGKLELSRKNESLEQAIAKLAATNHTLAHAVEGIAEINDSGQISDFNSSYAEMHGYAGLELAQFHWQTLISKEDHEKVAEAVAEMIVDGKSRCEVRGRRRDGSTFYEEIVLVEALGVDGKKAASHWFTRDITQRKELEAQIKHQAFHDTLTGLPNRHMFVDSLRSACQHSRRRGDALAVLFLDLDDFKSINDTMGHEAGDQMLAGVAERIQASVRKGDVVARLGGDEFTVLLNNLHQLDEAIEVAERIIKGLQTPIRIPAGKAFASTSIGIAFSRGEHTAEALLHDADIAMYQAKENNKSCYAVFSPDMNDHENERRELATDLRKAIDDDQLSLHYQPLIDLTSGRSLGIEAFLRWHDPIRGEVSPQLMISVVDDAGLMDAIWDWTLRHACAQMKEWLEVIPQDSQFTMSVNLSGKELVHPDLINTISLALKESQLPPVRLSIEVSAKSIAALADRALEPLQDLKKLGVRLALDDFGTGTHLISKLGDYPFDMVKIDSSITWLLESEPEARALALAMVIMAKSANIEVVAEGIETLSQLQHLNDLGCRVGQGYIFGKPMTGELLLPKLTGGAFIPLLAEKQMGPEQAA